MGCTEDEKSIENLFSESEMQKYKKEEELKNNSSQYKRQKKNKKNKKKLKKKTKDNITSSDDISSLKKIEEETDENEEEEDINTDTKKTDTDKYTKNEENEEEEEINTDTKKTDSDKYTKNKEDEEEEESNTDNNESNRNKYNKNKELIEEDDDDEEEENEEDEEEEDDDEISSKIENESSDDRDKNNNKKTDYDNTISNSNEKTISNSNGNEKKTKKKHKSKKSKESKSSKKSKGSESQKSTNKDNQNPTEDKLNDEAWFNKYINQTNEYNRKNINSSISPDDPVLSSMIASKEKELKISSEDLVGQYQGNPSKKYKVLDILGSGSFGKVFKALNTLTKNLVAIKKTKKYINKNKNKDYDEPAYINVKNEIELLKKLSHPNIVKIYEFYDIREFYFIINEYCKYGDLSKFYKFHFSEKQICIILYQILSGVLYLHENNIIHRDMKLENIMVDHIEKDLSTSEPYFFIKIIDFGSSKIYSKEQQENLIIGTSYYIAPEVINKKYNEKCDIWSVGVILYMLIAKKPPFNGKNNEDIFEKITNEDYNKHSTNLLEFSEEARDLIGKLLEKNIDKRLSAKEALNHPWFKEFNGRAAFANFKFDDFNLILDKFFNAKKLNKLQELVLNFLVHNSPSNPEFIKILKIFRFLNTSGDCILTKNELKKGLYKYKIKSEVNIMVDNLFKKLEIKDENGYIGYEQFIGICIEKDMLFTKENLKYAFNFINDNQGETITSKQIIKAFNIKNEKISEALFNDIIIKIGKKKDGTLAFSEFEAIMRS